MATSQSLRLIAVHSHKWLLSNILEQGYHPDSSMTGIARFSELTFQSQPLCICGLYVYGLICMGHRHEVVLCHMQR